MRYSATSTCDGCETHMSHFLLTAGLKCPCHQDFSSHLSLQEKRARGLEPAHGKPTGVLTSLLAWGSALAHSISPPGESCRANFKAYTCHQRAEGNASHALLLWAASCYVCHPSLLWQFVSPCSSSHSFSTHSHRVK